MTTFRTVTAWTVAGVTAALATTALVATTHHRRIAELRRVFAESESDSEPPVWLPADREFTVTADDGVALSVDELGPADGGAPELTVVLAHGYTLDRRCWRYQRHALAHSTVPRIRQVSYDHRSHGCSGRSPRSGCTIEQLGRDLGAVIRAVAPAEPVVLIGHSLGGMTIMALAEHQPELFAEQIRGVAFLNTAAGDIGRSGLPRPVLSRRNPVVHAAAWLSRGQPDLIERIRRLGRHLIWSLTRRLAFDDPAVGLAEVELMDTMLRGTSLEVMTDFLPTLGLHSRYDALAGLQHVTTLVLGADADLLVPFEHSTAIATLLPDAELVQVPGSGHMTMLEQPKLVTGHLLDLLYRCSERIGRSRQW